MTKAEIRLNVGNLKQIKAGYQQLTFYLNLTAEDGSIYITSCKNVLFDDAAFQVSDFQQIRKIELWNYDSCKRVGTLHIKKDMQARSFQHLFKNHNIKLSLDTQEAATYTAAQASSKEEKPDWLQSRSTDQECSSEEEL